MLSDDEPLRMRQGQEVEKVAHGLFKKGVEVKGYGEAGSKETMKLIEKGASVIYQAQAMTDQFLARTDILVKREDGWHLYEVKSSTEVKKKNIHDLKFQANVFKLVGVKLKSVNLIYVNKKYFFDKKKGLELDQLFIVKNMTRRVMSGLRDELINMKKAHKVLVAKKRPVLLSLKKNFERDLPPLMEKEYYKGLPEYSIYRISGVVGRGKLEELTEKGIVDMRDIPADYPLTVKQWEQVNLTKKKGKEVDKKGIKLAL
ncbi:hypothetical protein KAR91_07870, partial [Candidatus Pacearchaeota archaeon]|nr:hypothetical protein [Candidatus Pacearchaeota archaeon]